MAFNIKDLILNVPDVNTGNRYMVEFFPPVELRNSSDIEKITFYCKSCTIPGFTIEQADRNVYGATRKIASGLEAVELTTSFIFDYKGINFEFFESWKNLIINKNTYRLSFYNDYIADIRITLLNNLNKPILECICEEAYPKIVTDLTLDYSSTEMLSIEVIWQVRKHFISKPGTDGNVSIRPIG